MTTADLLYTINGLGALVITDIAAVSLLCQELEAPPSPRRADPARDRGRGALKRLAMNINTESYRASINGMLDRLSTNEMSEAARLMTNCGPNSPQLMPLMLLRCYVPITRHGIEEAQQQIADLEAKITRAGGQP